MEKRGQVSIFIVLGVVILLIIASLLFLSGVVQTSSLEQDDAVDLQRHAVYVQQYVDNCVEDTAAKSLVTLGYRGGKDALVGPFFDEEFFDSNYVLYNGDSHVATVQEMESHLEGLMDKHVQDCLPPADNNNILVENDIVNPGTLFQSLRMNHDNPTTDVTIMDEQVLFTVDWPLTLRHGDAMKEMNDFSPEPFHIELVQIATFLEELVTKSQQHPSHIDAFHLLSQNMTIDVTVFNETSVFLLTDQNSLIDYTPFQFLFAMHTGVAE